MLYYFIWIHSPYRPLQPINASEELHQLFCHMVHLHQGHPAWWILARQWYHKLLHAIYYWYLSVILWLEDGSTRGLSEGILKNAWCKDSALWKSECSFYKMQFSYMHSINQHLCWVTTQLLKLNIPVFCLS